MAFKSRKLNGVEKGTPWPTHEKEMTAVVHSLQQWLHYLLGGIFTVVTDNVANNFFKQGRHVGKSSCPNSILNGCIVQDDTT